MATTSLLITQCLQNDFVKPIDRFDPIPNQLHVGHAEALRLLGATPAEGPVERMMQWAYAQSDALVRVIHIRDWHDPAQPDQASHLAQFGEHCIRDSEGAAFAFGEPDRHGKDVGLVDSVTLNDFEGTTLAALLSPYAGTPRRVGLIGVWTEAKVLFLAYELRTRHPSFELAVCSALTASSSRQHHFQALDQLARIVGVRVIDSVGEFIDWLGGGRASGELPLPGLAAGYPEIDAGSATLDPADARLIRFLFRDCRRVSLKLMGGGFSGNLVAGTTSIDVQGHEQVPHVVKIGPRSTMARERTSFERIQNVMGNNAPQISDFADQGERGAIKYRYASMGGTFSTTFQKEYQRGLELDEVRRILDTVFGEQLMRLYKAATLESGDLLEHYYFAPERAAGVQRAVEAIMGGPVGDTLELVPGVVLRNPTRFYDTTLAQLPARPQDRFHQAYVHGDLNGQNIVLDGHRNVWLIDFFHTRRAHVLMDLVKLENDLLYIFTPIRDEAELREGMRLTDALLELDDLWAAPAEQSPSSLPAMQRAWATLRMLRAHHPRLVQSDRSPLQLLVAQLRYAGHTLSFDEPTLLQRRWALYTASRCISEIEALLGASTRLRVDMLDGPRVGPARVGLTILPGRRDWRRNLAADLEQLRSAGVDAVACLVPLDELERYGVGELLDAYRSAGLELLHLPLLDQRGAGREVLHEAVTWIESRVVAGRTLAIHCVGGLGRSGMVAAAWLRSRGASVDEALTTVRAARGPRAVETPAQEQSVRAFV
jgi:protein-tyrosine phosphatase/nicotinamidase-related amidase